MEAVLRMTNFFKEFILKTISSECHLERGADAEQKPTPVENPVSRKMHQEILGVQDRDIHVVGTHSFLSIGFGQPPPAYSI